MSDTYNAIFLTGLDDSGEEYGTAGETGSGSKSSNPLEPSNTTTFDGNVITQTFNNGNSLTTTFNDDGSITEVFVDVDAGTTTTNTTVFNDDGSISVTSR